MDGWLIFIPFWPITEKVSIRIGSFEDAEDAVLNEDDQKDSGILNEGECCFVSFSLGRKKKLLQAGCDSF